jgi:hypothetical protein
MIHEEICTYEVCKLAKDKGFPQDVFGTCKMNSSCYLEDGRFHKGGCICPIDKAYTAPTQSLLQRWLREERNIHIVVFPNLRNSYAYDWIVYIKGEECWLPTYSGLNDFDTYELALEDALAYSLKNLV